MDREDRRRYFVFGSCFFEIVAPVFSKRLENDYRSRGMASLRDFLNSRTVLHILFHLRHRNISCCVDNSNCTNNAALPLNYSQWNLLYTENPGPGIHNCHCKYTAKLVQLDDLDITLAGQILLNCCGLSPSEVTAIRSLRQYKNDYLSHNTKGALTESDFKTAWADLEISILQLDSTKQDDIIRIFNRPLDESLCSRYIGGHLDVHKKLDEVFKSWMDPQNSMLNRRFEQLIEEPEMKEKEKKITSSSAELLKTKGYTETKERENFFRILALLSGDRIPVVQAYIQQVISTDKCKTFEEFLNTEKHIIFHECTPNHPCCYCDEVSLASSSKRRSLRVDDFTMLYDQKGVDETHVIKRSKKIVKHCICGITAKKDVTVDVINTNIAIMILRKFSRETVQQRKWLHQIKQVMYYLMYNGKRQIEEPCFRNYWSFLKLSFLGLAKSISTGYHQRVNKQLDLYSNFHERTSVEENRSVTTIRRCLDIRQGMQTFELSGYCSEDPWLKNELLAKMLYLCFDLGIGVVHTFFENVILNNNDFYKYLITKKHYLFHKYSPDVLCCECKTKNVVFKNINKRQFQQLYMEVNTKRCGINNEERECICKYEPCKSLSVKDINVFVISTILNELFQPIKNLESVSKFLLFDLTIKNSKLDLLNDKCRILKKSVIDIAETVGPKFGDVIRREITALNFGGNVKTMVSGDEGLYTSFLNFPKPKQWYVSNTNSATKIVLSRPTDLCNNKMEDKLPEVNGPWKGKLCESCEFRDIKVIASVGCLVCDQCLCKHCLDHHKATKTFQDHQVVPLDEYMQRPDNKEFICDKHSFNLDFFCASHDAPLCLKCIAQDHKSCTVILMTEAEEQFKTYRLANLKERTCNLLKDVQITHTNALTDLKSYFSKRRRLIKEFDKKFKLSVDRFKTHLLENLDINERTTEEIAKSLKEQEEILNAVSTELPSLTMPMFNSKSMNKVLEMEKKIKEQEKHFKELESKKKLMSSELDIRLDIVSTGKNFDKNRSDFNSDIVQLRSLQVESSRALDSQDIMNFRLKKELPFTLPKAKKEIQIRGCAILDDNTACFGDRGNNRLIFMTTKGYLKEIKLPSAPVDIACINGTQIAVTLYDSKSLKIFDTEKWEWGEFIFRDKHGLTGIAFGDELIIVRTGGTGYCLLNLNGKPNYTIPKPDSNMPYVACAKDKFYSAKWDTNEVYCFDKSGKTIWQFKDESIINPANGVSADIDGNVYVTGSYSNSVAVISADGKKCKQLIHSSRNLDNPIAIDYHKTNNKLLVSAASGHAVLYSVIRI
ncbi:unnamed protein product [Mytilus coruscus]|uniref:B box-type domain-containing protein n=1 Tax=Mytilus coruscus TaxID=42192 RepID=A0A6J8DX71_MYTCO|nr:unnamed protein product [Mytilus coruscus]